MDQAKVNPKISIQAKVYRINWERKPRFISKSLWLYLGKKRLPFVGKWENLGKIN